MKKRTVILAGLLAASLVLGGCAASKGLETDAIKIGKVNVDEEQMLALKFGITSIPTLMLFKDGKEADKLVGLRSKEELKQLLGL